MGLFSLLDIYSPRNILKTCSSMKKTFPLLAVVLIALFWAGCADNSQPSRGDWDGPTLSDFEQTDDGAFVDPDNNTPVSGPVGGAMLDRDDEFVEGELVDGRWHGPMKVYFTDDDGREFLRVSREYKNGVPVGTSYTYYPNGNVLAEVRYTDEGRVDCAINYDEEGNKTADSCSE